MKIYVAHSRNYDFKNELYLPLQNSSLAQKHTFIFPHKDTDKPFNSRDLLKNNECDLVLAEVSHSATGQGIELGWADAFEVDIICMYKSGSKISGSLKVVSDIFIEYTNAEDIISRLADVLKNV